MRTLLNVMNINKDDILGHHLTQRGEGSRMGNKALIKIHIIIITYFK